MRSEHISEEDIILRRNKKIKISNKTEVWIYLESDSKYWNNFSSKSKYIPSYVLLCLKTILKNCGRKINIITNYNVSTYLSDIDMNIINNKALVETLPLY